MSENEIPLGPFVLKKTQLEIKELPAAEDWEMALNFLLFLARNHPWWIGDLISYGEARFGEEFYNAIVPDPTTADMIGRHAAIARRFKASERWPELSWSHHREVVRLNHQARKEVLQYAIENGIASGKMREAVRAVEMRLKGGG